MLLALLCVAQKREEKQVAAVDKKLKKTTKQLKTSLKRTKTSSKRLQALPKLIKSVQALANKYARLRDCDGTGGAGCISCGKWFPYEELDGGHYIPTTTSSTRFNEENIHGQCWKCNRFLHGNLRGYFRGLEKKLGRERLDALEASATSRKWTRLELEELKTYYKDKINGLGRMATTSEETAEKVLDLLSS